jgi:hypothetical protein
VPQVSRFSRPGGFSEYKNFPRPQSL